MQIKIHLPSLPFPFFFLPVQDDDITILQEIPAEQKRIMEDDQPPPFSIPPNYTYHHLRLTNADLRVVKNAPQIIGASILVSMPFHRTSVHTADFEDIIPFVALRTGHLPNFVLNYYLKRMELPSPPTNAMLLYKALRMISFHRMLLFPHATIDVASMWATHKWESKTKANI